MRPCAIPPRSPFNYVRALANEQRRRKLWRKPVDAGVGFGWRVASDATARIASAASAKLRLARAGPRLLTEAAAREDAEDDADVDIFSV